MVSNAKEDLPDPDKPVNTMRASRGSSRVRFLRLCSRAPWMTRESVPTEPECTGGFGHPRSRQRRRYRASSGNVTDRPPTVVTESPTMVARSACTVTVEPSSDAPSSKRTGPSPAPNAGSNEPSFRMRHTARSKSTFEPANPPGAVLDPSDAKPEIPSTPPMSTLAARSPSNVGSRVPPVGYRARYASDGVVAEPVRPGTTG